MVALGGLDALLSVDCAVGGGGQGTSNYAEDVILATEKIVQDENTPSGLKMPVRVSWNDGGREYPRPCGDIARLFIQFCYIHIDRSQYTYIILVH